jgi:hypothetical protein
MAQKIQTLFIDDIDGSEADGTVRFGLDGTDYEIDLSAAHAADLRAALAPFAAASRKVPGPARRPGRAARKAAAVGISTTEIREWARIQGIEVKDRGRVPAGIVARYHDATAK